MLAQVIQELLDLAEMAINRGVSLFTLLLLYHHAVYKVYIIGQAIKAGEKTRVIAKRSTAIAHAPQKMLQR